MISMDLGTGVLADPSIAKEMMKRGVKNKSAMMWTMTALRLRRWAW
jgi:hypothetical protein